MTGSMHQSINKDRNEEFNIPNYTHSTRRMHIISNEMPLLTRSNPLQTSDQLFQEPCIPIVT